MAKSAIFPIQPKLELQKKHTIEVVVDRFKVRDDLTQRLAESFETALELSGGTAVVADMDDPKAEELLFSANFACPICGYSISASWNLACFHLTTRRGACPTCDGLGVQQYFDPDREIPESGIVAGWRCDPWLGSPQLLLFPDAEIAGRSL